MTADIVVEEAQRARWARWLHGNKLDDAESDGFALGGLGARSEELGGRFVVLPSDPEHDNLQLDGAFWEWFRRASTAVPAFAKQPIDWGHSDCPTSGGGARVEMEGRKAGAWRRWLMAYRSGGIEFGFQGRERDKRRTFFLLAMVGRIWAALDIGRDLVEKYAIGGPHLAILALRGTQGALLTGFGGGWSQDEFMYETVPCRDRGLLISHRFETWPDANGSKALALRIGGCIEDAFGSKHRRFSGRREGQEAEFDAASFE